MKPKASPDYDGFDLGKVLASVADPGRSDPGLHQAAANSLRCIEVINQERDVVQAQMGRQYPQDLGILVPDRLLMRAAMPDRRQGRIEAAVTTTTTAAGAIDPLLLPDWVDLLTDFGSVLAMARIYSGLTMPIDVPRVTAAPSPSHRIEGAAGVGAGTLSVEKIEWRPHQLISYFAITPESFVTSGGMAIELASVESMRLMAEQCERDFWAGDGTGGAITGVDAILAAQASTPRVTAYVNNTGITSADVVAMRTRMSLDKVMPAGRSWVGTPTMWGELIQKQLHTYFAPLVENMQADGKGTMLGYPAMESSFPEEGATAANGRLYHLSMNDIGIAFFGQQVEYLVDREQGSGDHQITMVKLWDVQLRRAQAAQLLKET